MNGRSAVVTGGRRGIGSAISIGLAARGFDVVVVDLERDGDAEATLEAIAGLGRDARFVTADIGDIAGHASILAALGELPGRPAALVNNAGVTSLVRGDMLALSPESFDRVMRVNLRGAFFLSQAFARALIDRGGGPDTPFRSITNITSANAELIGVNRADYCMSKAGMSMMSRLFAARLAAEGINVYEVRPGMIRTDMTAPAAQRYDAMLADGAVPIARWGEPADIGDAVARLADGAFPFTTGSFIEVDGGLHMHRV
jgi:NAD(P)-dependent dehydrogenase (short-subunit alcohol dehydrogenase family)